MIDSTSPQGAPDVAPQAIHEVPSTAVLAKSVRTLRIWLIILTSFIALVFAGVSAVAILGFVGFTSIVSETGQGVSQDEISSMKSEIRDAYGDRLESVEVRSVKVDEGAPFPYSIVAGAAGESVFVQYKLKDSPVVVADVVGGPYGNDIASSGMLPTQGSLTSRMTAKQLSGLFDAYAAQTKLPLGSVRRYGDKSDFEDTGDSPSVSSVVSVGDKKYKTSELWSVAEGKMVTGDSLNLDGGSDGMRKAFIFHEDPKTGQFTFLGTESVNSMW